MPVKAEPKKIMTVPEITTRSDKFSLTGNEFVSLPYINQGGAVESINVLNLSHRGLLEFSGNKEMPLLSPLVMINNETVDLCRGLNWHYHLNWLPAFSLSFNGNWTIEGEIVAPTGCKGFYYRLTLINTGDRALSARLGWQGHWNSFNYIVFSRRSTNAQRNISYNKWTKSLILEASAGLPMAALALAAEPETEWHFNEKDCRFSSIHEIKLANGESFSALLYAAVNLEGDGAGTTAIDLRRHGHTALKKKTCGWLEDRQVGSDDDGLTALLNRNLFFCYYYALARALDSEELVAITSRSPRYYVSAAFWSRDALLWSFPAIMLIDHNIAREMLLAVFSRHISNAGDHAHYINGSILYPGFELDQLAAYYLALEHYLCHSKDYSILDESIIRNGLITLTEKAFEQFDPESGLYSTFLDPSDDPVSFPFLTYNNALLQRAFNFLSVLQSEERWYHKSDFAILAGELRQAIYEHCTVKGPFGMMFAWSVDGKGRFSLYDNPPGSLQLLAHYGFCSIEDTVFNNTVRWIRSSNNKYYHQGSRFEEAGSHHAGNPWPLGACNDLLACNAGAIDFLKRAEMDNGFFCETVDPETGRVSTGAAFASAAGFLAYALYIKKTE